MNAAHFLTHLSLTTFLIIALPFAGALLAGQVFDHIYDRFRIDWKSRRVVRRWYTTGARVRPSITFPSDPVYQVTTWECESGPVWVKIATPGDPDDLNWVRLSDLGPHEVPAFRPHLCHGLPHLTRYIPAGAA